MILRKAETDYLTPNRSVGFERNDMNKIVTSVGLIVCTMLWIGFAFVSSKEIHNSRESKDRSIIAVFELKDGYDNYLGFVNDLKELEKKRLEEKQREEARKLELAKAEAQRKRLEEEKRKKELAKKQEAERKARENKSGNGNIIYEGTFNVSFYSADYNSTGRHKEDKYYGVTASGAKVQLGVTAACAPNIPFGTKIYIEGYGERICQDRGSAINNPYKVDIYVLTEEEAYANGRKYLYGKVYK